MMLSFLMGSQSRTLNLPAMDSYFQNLAGASVCGHRYRNLITGTRADSRQEGGFSLHDLLGEALLNDISLSLRDVAVEVGAEDILIQAKAIDGFVQLISNGRRLELVNHIVVRVVVSRRQAEFNEPLHEPESPLVDLTRTWFRRDGLGLVVSHCVDEVVVASLSLPLCIPIGSAREVREIEESSDADGGPQRTGQFEDRVFGQQRRKARGADPEQDGKDDAAHAKPCEENKRDQGGRNDEAEDGGDGADGDEPSSRKEEAQASGSETRRLELVERCQACGKQHGILHQSATLVAPLREPGARLCRDKDI